MTAPSGAEELELARTESERGEIASALEHLDRARARALKDRDGDMLRQVVEQVGVVARSAEGRLAHESRLLLHAAIQNLRFVAPDAPVPDVAMPSHSVQRAQPAAQASRGSYFGGDLKTLAFPLILAAVAFPVLWFVAVYTIAESYPSISERSYRLVVLGIGVAALVGALGLAAAWTRARSRLPAERRERISRRSTGLAGLTCHCGLRRRDCARDLPLRRLRLV